MWAASAMLTAPRAIARVRCWNPDRLEEPVRYGGKLAFTCCHVDEILPYPTTWGTGIKGAGTRTWSATNANDENAEGNSNVLRSSAEFRYSVFSPSKSSSRVSYDDAALDDAKSVEALRAGYKTLLREVTARHERARRTMEEEMETLRARVRALETERASTAATISGSQTRMKSPRREILAPDSPDDGDGLSPLSYELSPLSTSEMTPPPRCALEEEEEAAQTPRAFLPPRPPSREGSGGDDRSWVEAWERAQLNNPAASLPTSLRPGQGLSLIHI